MANNKKILIVDDDHSLRYALSDEFTKRNLTALEGKDGQEGLKMALVEHPDIILLDVVMPEMDGIAMLRELRKDKWGKTAKVIMFTNLNNTEQLSEAMELGSFHYLIKTDHSIEDIVNKVIELLNAPR